MPTNNSKLASSLIYKTLRVNITIALVAVLQSAGLKTSQEANTLEI
jgi:hypothetical protein